MKNADFNSDGNFMCFVEDGLKTGFSAIPIKAAVHRAEHYVLCGRHRFTRISILLKNDENSMIFSSCIRLLH